MNGQLATPGDRPWLEAALHRFGRAWEPVDGLAFVAREGEVVAMARVVSPEPGEGYHREHVRRIDACGPADDVAAAARALGSLGPRVRRLELTSPTSDEALLSVARTLDLVEEFRVRGAWRQAGGTRCDLVGFGHVRSTGTVTATPASAKPATKPDPSAIDGEPVLVHRCEPAERPALRRFLDALPPGRAYPPGALLTDAEEAETRRKGDLELPWVVAVAGNEIVGGVVLETPVAPERSHVRRVHVDVARPYRGRGIATTLLRSAHDVAVEDGVEILEADPRVGHAVVAALGRAGFESRGVQRVAWRMRTATRAWDDDIVIMSRAVQSEP